MFDLLDPTTFLKSSSVFWNTPTKDPLAGITFWLSTGGRGPALIIGILSVRSLEINLETNRGRLARWSAPVHFAPI
jgi:hypothetical protein